MELEEFEWKVFGRLRPVGARDWDGFVVLVLSGQLFGLRCFVCYGAGGDVWKISKKLLMIAVGI